MAHILEPIKTKGMEVKVLISGDGQFEAEVPDHGMIRSDTYAKLKDLVQTAVAKVVDRRTKAKPVPVTIIGTPPYRYGRQAGLDEMTFTPATLTGVHAQNRDLLVTSEKLGKKRIGHYDGTVVKPMKTGDINNYKALLKAKDDAEKAVNAWKREWVIDSDKATKLLGLTSEKESE